jgi:flagellin-specific chaperone FliS
VSLNGTAQQLADQAAAHYKAAQQALRNGDLATYQAEIDKVGQLLNQLGKVLGTPAPSAP